MTMWTRRGFLAAGAAALPLCAAAAGRQQESTSPHVRATDGDSAREPQWDERLTITVGPDKADIQGTSDRAIQAAVDYVARLGGGTVQLLPGTFTLRNGIHLASGMRLRGSGRETIVTRIPSETVELVADSDWYDQEITLSRQAGFQVGDGIVLRAQDPHNGSAIVIKRTLIARSGQRFKLSDGLRKNLWLSGKPTCSSLFPLLTSERTADVVIEALTLDGNANNTENLNGNYAGGVFLQDCNRYTMRDVESRNYNGDGISFQICHDVVVENCHCHDNRGLGLHPGSGSQRPQIRNNRLERNTIGLFWCWGVRFGLAEGNRIESNRDYGISIGHNDTDNEMRNNDIRDSGRAGILFRDDRRGQDFWANRNTVVSNRITNSGPKDGVGIDITGQTGDLRIEGNTITETREPLQRVGIRIAKEAQRIRLADNRFQGLGTDLLDLRPGHTESDS